MPLTPTQTRGHIEIEKKFLLPRFPYGLFLHREGPFRDVRGRAVHQGYLFTEPGEMRLRSVPGEDKIHFYLTTKSDGALSREEQELKISHWCFECLWPHTEGRRIDKVRYEIPHKDGVVYLDQYLEQHYGLVMLECEFPNEEAASRFVLPDWAVNCGAVEVTDDPRYYGKRLAVNGVPRV